MKKQAAQPRNGEVPPVLPAPSVAFLGGEWSLLRENAAVYNKIIAFAVVTRLLSAKAHCLRPQTDGNEKKEAEYGKAVFLD